MTSAINVILENSNPIETAFINNLFEDITECFESYVRDYKTALTFGEIIEYMKGYFTENLTTCVEYSPVMSMIRNVFDLKPNVYDLFNDIDIKFNFYQSENISNIDFSNIEEDDLHNIIHCEHFHTVDITFSDKQLEVLKTIDMVDFLGSLINEQTNIDCITVNGYAYDEVKECI
ncbi:hypothetical protein [Lysinibacillus sp. NPDC086135]|uniref:hypothetical protein n=1 Tax=Lysinibacillus sp. NPDC086135 TaxID=3364130 RepID=UPI003801F1BC